MKIALWISQVVLAAMFIMAGSMKAFTPIVEMADKLPWVLETPAALVRFIGISEIAGGLGLLLPSLLRIMPKLTVFAALGLVTIMVFALVFHISRGEYAAIGFNAILGAVAGFIAYGRWKLAPIAAK